MPSTSQTSTTVPSTSTNGTSATSTTGSETTSSSPGMGLGTTSSRIGGTGGGQRHDNGPIGTSGLASTGASPLLGALVGLGALLVVLGGLLLVLTRRFRRQSGKCRTIL
ncbi:hypothetical protein [Amycolatopsis sp. NPDC051102]|uniref:hypothetical protein n=1 Tax=Amycolatopsis sp. NPDC051102 TaxID=3155163 RepID=UPI003413C512